MSKASRKVKCFAVSDAPVDKAAAAAPGKSDAPVDKAAAAAPGNATVDEPSPGTTASIETNEHLSDDYTTPEVDDDLVVESIIDDVEDDERWLEDATAHGPLHRPWKFTKLEVLGELERRDAPQPAKKRKVGTVVTVGSGDPLQAADYAPIYAPDRETAPTYGSTIIESVTAGLPSPRSPTPDMQVSPSPSPRSPTPDTQQVSGQPVTERILMSVFAESIGEGILSQARFICAACKKGPLNNCLILHMFGCREGPPAMCNRHFQSVVKSFMNRRLMPSALHLLIVLQDRCWSPDRGSDAMLLRRVADWLETDWTCSTINAGLRAAVEVYLTSRIGYV